MIFVDTNVWLRSVQPTHPLHQAAVDTIARLIEANVYGISRIVTFNGDDFTRYPHIETIEP